MKGTVLIVDDESHVREYLSTIIHSLGFQNILFAEDGVEAVEKFKSENPFCVLLDINLPGQPGVDALSEMRKHDKNAIIIMITSVDTMRSVQDCVSLGANHYILKSNPASQLIQELKKTLLEKGCEL